MQKLSEEAIAAEIRALEGWSRSGEAIVKEFTFRSFAPAVQFVNRVAERAEAANHHPDILIRYNRVQLTLSTHDAGGLTPKDFALAREIEGIVQ
jgi:4a-hydroxytetrahydrobiopterin dehydratase